ncbi:uncharacterized protein UTRI_10548 [Ustilago trichophora]|uniref:Effector family protein Eff1 n=1 Tax=Ustilago trichophora TaxID=86804 RepID=A0A5C3ECU5_9BASI|nr:uncharacterized protein UTRI_10548 [Ustilago trichophora]
MLLHLASHPPKSILLLIVLVSLTSRTFSRPVGGHDDQHVGELSHFSTPPETSGFEWQADPFNGMIPATSTDPAEWPIGSSASHYNKFTLSHPVPPLFEAYQYYANAPIPQDRQTRLISLPTTQASFQYHGSPVSQFQHPQGFAQHFQPLTTAAGSERGRTAVSAARSIPLVPIWSEAPPIVATTRMSSGPNYNGGSHQGSVVMDSTAAAQASIGQSSASREDISPVPAKALDRSELVLRSGRKLGEWENIMRTLLENPNLEFEGVDGLHPSLSRVIIASNAMDVQDHHPTALQPRASEGVIRPHFTEALLAQQSLLEQHSLAGLDLGPSMERVFVYLNSRSNMESLNRHYFMDKMHFLPIKTSELPWKVVNGLLTHRERILILPPATPGGMPLLMARHLGYTKKIRQMQKLTGVLGSQEQLVSLWSPMLEEEGRKTFVLHGIGQLDNDDAGQVSLHLQELKNLWGEKAHQASWNLAELFPRGSMML